MARFDEYADRYQSIAMERRDGILQMTFHTDGGPLKWGEIPHREFGYAFTDVGSDTENKVIIITGTGDDYCAEYPVEGVAPGASPSSGTPSTGRARGSCSTCWTSRCL